MFWPLFPSSSNVNCGRIPPRLGEIVHGLAYLRLSLVILGGHYKLPVQITHVPPLICHFYAVKRGKCQISRFEGDLTVAHNLFDQASMLQCFRYTSHLFNSRVSSLTLGFLLYSRRLGWEIRFYFRYSSMYIAGNCSFDDVLETHICHLNSRWIGLFSEAVCKPRCLCLEIRSYFKYSTSCSLDHVTKTPELRCAVL